MNKIKLSSRLKYLAEYPLLSHPDQIYDLCCDHGILGIELAIRHPQSIIHFVDIKDHIIDELKFKLEASPIKNYEVYSANILDLEIKNNATVFIAGVGGILIAEFLKKNYKKFTNVDYLICCNQQLHILRDELRSLEVPCHEEGLIFSQGKFYEIFHLGPTSDKPVNIQFQNFDFNDTDHYQYLLQMEKHYLKKLKYEKSSDIGKKLEQIAILKVNFICTT